MGGDVVGEGVRPPRPSERTNRRARPLTAGDGAEPLLPGRVPYLQLDPLAVDQHLAHFEV